MAVPHQKKNNLPQPYQAAKRAFWDRRSDARRSRASRSIGPPESTGPPESVTQPESFDRSLGDLLRQLLHDFSHLIHQEIALVKAEINEKLMLLATVAGLFAGAAILGLFAFGVLTAAIVLVIDLWLPAWLAAVIVTGAYLAIAGVLVLIARSRLKKAGGPVPEQTVESLKEEVAWAKEQGKVQPAVSLTSGGDPSRHHRHARADGRDPGRRGAPGGHTRTGPRSLRQEADPGHRWGRRAGRGHCRHHHRDSPAARKGARRKDRVTNTTNPGRNECRA